jgi:hypothetical protein
MKLHYGNRIRVEFNRHNPLLPPQKRSGNLHGSGKKCFGSTHTVNTRLPDASHPNAF